MAEEFLPENFEVGELRVEYKKAAVLGDVLTPVYCVNENQVTVTLTDEAGKTCAIVQFEKGVERK